MLCTGLREPYCSIRNYCCRVYVPVLSCCALLASSEAVSRSTAAPASASSASCVTRDTSSLNAIAASVALESVSTAPLNGTQPHCRERLNMQPVNPRKHILINKSLDLSRGSWNERVILTIHRSSTFLAADSASFFSCSALSSFGFKSFSTLVLSDLAS